MRVFVGRIELVVIVVSVFLVRLPVEVALPPKRPHGRGGHLHVQGVSRGEEFRLTTALAKEIEAYTP
jgi:hypothetical protein